MLLKMIFKSTLKPIEHVLRTLSQTVSSEDIRTAATTKTETEIEIKNAGINGNV